MNKFEISEDIGFYKIHTTLKIDFDTLNVIRKVDGANLVSLHGKYLVEFTIGELFEEEEVLSKVNDTMKTIINNNK